MSKNEIIQLWKEKGIEYGTFIFDCGGDSMGDTEFKFSTKNGEELDEKTNSTLENYFESRIYNEVEFYEVSDGVYHGESGTVEITLNEDEMEFDYIKSSMEEWNETECCNIRVPLTEEQKRVLQTYVKDIIGSNFDWVNNEQTIFSEDNIIGEEELEMIEELINQIKDECQGQSDDLVSIIEEIEGFSFDLTNEEEFDMNINEEGLLVYVNFSGITYKEAE